MQTRIEEASVTNQVDAPRDARLELIEKLDEIVARLSSSPEVKSACERLNEAVKGADAHGAANDFKKAFEPLTTVVKIADQIDPHVLTPEELAGLGDSSTDQLVRKALTKGALRERRMLLQAAEANTNRRIARWAIAAIFVNASATLVAGLI
jgi:hypothetical protein